MYLHFGRMKWWWTLPNELYAPLELAGTGWSILEVHDGRRDCWHGSRMSDDDCWLNARTGINLCQSPVAQELAVDMIHPSTYLPLPSFRPPLPPCHPFLIRFPCSLGFHLIRLEELGAHSQPPNVFCCISRQNNISRYNIMLNFVFQKCLCSMERVRFHKLACLRHC